MIVNHEGFDMSPPQTIPDIVTIKKSGISSLGLFPTRKIHAGTNIGCTHMKMRSDPQSYLRTPLGGFFNHRSRPNTKAQIQDEKIYLVAARDISVNEEITAPFWYQFYAIRIAKDGM